MCCCDLFCHSVTCCTDITVVVCRFQTVALKLQKEVKHYVTCVKGDFWISVVVVKMSAAVEH